MAFVDANVEDNPASYDNVEQQEQKSHGESDADQPLSKDAVFGSVVSTSMDDGHAHRRDVNRDRSVDNLFAILKKTPEVTSLISTLVDDIMGHGMGIRFVSNRSDLTGERKVAECRRFIDSGYKIQLEQALYDMFVAGDGYLWKNRLSNDEVKSFVDDVVDRQSWNNGYMKDAARRMLEQKVVDEAELSTRKVQAVPASTIEHQINKFGDVTTYHQEVSSGQDVYLDPDKVINYPLMRMNGRTYSFTPMKTIITEISALNNIKDTHSVFFGNAAIANKIFKVQGEGPKSDNVRLLKQTIKKFRKVRNKHKDLVLTGDIEVEDLNMMAGDMEFRELAEYLTRVLMMAWGVPPSRLSDSTTSDPSTGGGTISSEGYYKRIRRLQDKVATIQNNELFLPEYDCKTYFHSPDIKTDIRKAERDLRQLEVIQRKIALGLMDAETARHHLGIHEFEAPSDVSDDDVRERAERLALSSNVNDLPNDQDPDEMVDPAQEADRQGKRQAASNNGEDV